jgi:ketol-acid reductoisomerase
MAKMYYEKDCNFELLSGKTIAVVGYGSQGHAHALNLMESCANVVVGLYEGSKSAEKAKEAGLKVMMTAEAVRSADIIMILVNDEKQSALYKNDIAPNLKSGAALAFAHGPGMYLLSVVIGGIGTGIQSTAQYNYHLENVPADSRATWLSWNQMLGNAAILLGSLVGPLS